MDPMDVPPQGALIIWGGFDQTLSPVSELDLNQWWTFEHLPERLAIPGFQRCRRYVASNPQAGRSKYLVWYEVSNLSTLTSAAYIKALNNPTDGTKRCIPVLTTLSRSACRILQRRYRHELRSLGNSGMIAGTIVHVVIAVPEGLAARNSLSQALEEVLTALLLETPTCVSFHIIEHDEAASRDGSTSASYANTKMQNKGNGDPSEATWMLLVELASPICSGVEESISKSLNKTSVRVLEIQSYQVVSVMSR